MPGELSSLGLSFGTSPGTDCLLLRPNRTDPVADIRTEPTGGVIREDQAAVEASGEAVELLMDGEIKVEVWC